MAVLIGGKRFWLWRAVDDEGEGQCHGKGGVFQFGR
jgi:transposase-like protein